MLKAGPDQQTLREQDQQQIDKIINPLNDNKLIRVQTQIVRVVTKQPSQKSSISTEIENSCNNEQEQFMNERQKTNEYTASNSEIPNENPNIILNTYIFNNIKYDDQICATEEQQKEKVQNSSKKIQIVELNEVVKVSKEQRQDNDIENKVDEENQVNNQQIEEQKVEEQVCRICLDGQQCPNTQLINVCDCKGSLMYIHKYCLYLQLSSRVKLEEFEKSAQQFKCELCKSLYRINTGVKYTFQNFIQFKQNLIKQIRLLISFLCLCVANAIISLMIIWQTICLHLEFLKAYKLFQQLNQNKYQNNQSFFHFIQIKFKFNLSSILFKKIFIFLQNYSINEVTYSCYQIKKSFTDPQHESQKSSVVGFMLFIFISLVTTASFISFLVLMHILLKAGIVKKIQFLHIFKDKEEFTKFYSLKNKKNQNSNKLNLQNE